MSQSDPVAPGPLERLRDFTAAQASKGNVSPKADVAAAWSDLVVEALRAAPGDLEPVLGLRGLRTPVLGRGLALAWPHLSADDKNGLARYLKSVDAERARSVRLSLFVELFDQDLASALGQLSQIPQGKRDVQSRLARLIKQNRERLGGIATSGAPNRDVAAAFLHLIEASGDVPAGVVADLLRAVVSWLISIDWEHDFLARKNAEALRTGLARLDRAFLPEFKAKLAGSPNLLAFVLPERDEAFPAPASATSGPSGVAATTETSGPPIGAEAPSPSAAAPEHPSSPPKSGGFDLTLLDASIRTLRDQLQQLENMRTAFQELQARHQASSEHAGKLTEQISRLDGELAQRRADSLRLEAELATAADEHRRTSKTLEDVSRRLDEATTAHNRERQELLNRLQLGIDGRLAAFKTSVADELSRVVQRLPAQGAPVSAELGAVLLTRLHEVLHVLDRVGIRAGGSEPR